ncbi:hypothetical protein Dda_2457 [Drechslerella dactyloides]|uniref:adenine phosphoribosyltransferase n=1 Tax=Drechslerella dactyloides TaxID=74499 RepID=A0AAD6IZJ1_DREDA|nr:hypothetical protein Dda_2457 [Drechslerella dactyloides]
MTDVTDAEEVPELTKLHDELRGALKQYPDFPQPGILFEDILPLFSSYEHHAKLMEALALQVLQAFPVKPDVIVGLDARGFLFGPSLALKLEAGFVPVRKKGKMPGECVSVKFMKEYGADIFEMQKGGIKPGQRVLVVDDIIATGGSAAAAGSLVRQLEGNLIGYLFILEIDVLKGREKLDAPVYTLLH